MPQSNPLKRKSQSSTPLKQGALGFTASKRTASANAEKTGKKNVKKSKSAPIKRTAVDEVEEIEKSSTDGTPADEIEDADSDYLMSEQEREEAIEEVKEEEGPKPQGRRKSRRISAKEAKVKAESKDIIQKKGMFRSRNSLDTPPDTIKPAQVKHADLADQNGKWRSHYGVVRGKMGHLQPIHAENETKVHHILRVFDLSYEYGPCVGVSRLERWERAKAMGLNPPNEVYEILNTKSGTELSEFSQCVFSEEV